MEWAIAIAVLAILAASVRRIRTGVRQPVDLARDDAAIETGTPVDADTDAPAAAIGDELDLHGVPGRDVDGLVDEFVEVSRAQGLTCITIVHGRGSGILRRRVRSRLRRHAGVTRFDDAAGRRGGATAVWLVPLAGDRTPV